MRRSLRLVLAAAVVAIGGYWGVVLRPRTPSAERNWIVEHARLARAEFLGDSLVRVRDVRHFDYTASSDFTPAYDDRVYDLRKIESAWFVLTPFSTRFRGPAHALVSFGFADSQFVAVSVEARREVGESYGFVAGVQRKFELAYIVGDERDLIGRRARFDGDEVFVYPVRAPVDRIRQVFVDMLQRANDLQQTPEFYNTLTSNCTSNLVDHVNRIVPGRVPSGWRTVLPGYVDALALSLGLIDADGDVTAVRARYQVNDRAQRAGVAPDFSQRIRDAS